MNPPLLAFGLPSGPDMIVIGILLLVLFGAKKLPLFGRGLGRSMDEFRKAREDFEDELPRAADESYRPAWPDPKPNHSTVGKLPLILFAIAIVILLLSFMARPH